MEMPSEAQMRERFAELGEQREAALAVSGPLRAQRDAITAQVAAKVAVLNPQIREAEVGLFAIDQERALIAKALGGRTGEMDG